MADFPQMDAEGQPSDYEVLEELGSGSFGVVYKGVEKSTGELVAIKHIDLEGTDDDINDIQQEISLLSTCASPFVTQYKTSFVRGVKLWIVMEYLGGGSCLDLVKIAPFAEEHAAIICRELLQGLNYLHSSGKIHRDIKAANVLLSHAGKVKIADFGVAAQLTNIKSQRMTFVGTPYWMAPEVIQEAGYDFKADIWSLGVTAMELVKGEPPNADLHPMKALFHIPKAPAPRLEGPQFSREFKSFVAACLVKDPDHRPSARDLLQHRFIQKAGRLGLLRDLIKKRSEKRAASEDSADLKYYEETLYVLPRPGVFEVSFELNTDRSRRSMSPQKEPDEWVFETIRPTILTANHSAKKRKISEGRSGIPLEPPTEMMMQLDLNQTDVKPSIDLEETGTVRFIPPQIPAQQSTVRKISTPIRRISQSTQSSPLSVYATPAAPDLRDSPTRRSSSRRMSQPTGTVQRRQPLSLDTSFGNSPSATRQFRRVSGSNSPTPQSSRPSSQATSAPTSDLRSDQLENIPPAAEAISKEAKLGRKSFAKIVDNAFQATYAQTASSKSREALAQVGLAWSKLDAVDPEGGAAFLRAIVERLQSETKLSSALGLGSSLARTPSAVTPSSAPSVTPSRRQSAAPTPTKAGAVDIRHRRQNSRPSQQQQQQQPMGPPVRPASGIPQRSPSKLVMAQSNPHLKSHARRQSEQVERRPMLSRQHSRQSSQVSFVSAVAEKTEPLIAQTEGLKLDQSKEVANVLYGRWLEGMKERLQQQG